MPPLVLDTNVVLDLLLFKDPQALAFQAALRLERWRWISTRAMRDELAHVLDYRHLQPRLAFYGLRRDDVLAAFDVHACLVEAAPLAMCRCRDQDDQKFIDLAVAHQATLISKDKQVLKMRKQLARLSVPVHAVAPGEAAGDLGGA